MTQEKWQDTLISIKNKMFTARNAKIAAATISTSAIWPAMKSKSPLWPI